MNARQQADIVIGLHIRRADYRKWNNGRFFFSDEQYSAMMSKIESYFRTHGKHVAFLVCSDEPIDSKAFSEHQVIPSIGQIIEDLYSLAACDYIIGPPSTYSGWAAFYGNVQLFHVTDPAQLNSLDDFFRNSPPPIRPCAASTTSTTVRAALHRR